MKKNKLPPEHSVAAAMIDGFMNIAENRYGIASIIRVGVNKDGGTQLDAVKHLGFVVSADGQMIGGSTAGDNFGTVEAFTILLAKRLNSESEDEYRITLTLFTTKYDKERTPTFDPQKPVASYQWRIAGKTLVPAEDNSKWGVLTMAAGPTFSRKDLAFGPLPVASFEETEEITVDTINDAAVETLELILRRAVNGNHQVIVTSEVGVMTVQFHKAGFITTMEDEQIERWASELTEIVAASESRGASIVLRSLIDAHKRQGIHAGWKTPQEIRSWFMTQQTVHASTAEQTQKIFESSRVRGKPPRNTTYHDAWNFTAG